MTAWNLPAAAPENIMAEPRLQRPAEACCRSGASSSRPPSARRHEARVAPCARVSARRHRRSVGVATSRRARCGSSRGERRGETPGDARSPRRWSRCSCPCTSHPVAQRGEGQRTPGTVSSCITRSVRGGCEGYVPRSAAKGTICRRRSRRSTVEGRERNVSKRTSSRDFLEIRARVESRRARDRAVTWREREGGEGSVPGA